MVHQDVFNRMIEVFKNEMKGKLEILIRNMEKREPMRQREWKKETEIENQRKVEKIRMESVRKERKGWRKECQRKKSFAEPILNTPCTSRHLLRLRQKPSSQRR